MNSIYVTVFLGVMFSASAADNSQKSSHNQNFLANDNTQKNISRTTHPSEHQIRMLRAMHRKYEEKIKERDATEKFCPENNSPLENSLEGSIDHF